MNNIKKIGLTALAGSLVATSAFAGELTASGSASMSVKNTTSNGVLAHSATLGGDSYTGKAWSMANSVYLAGSGELDNGLAVSMSFEMDQGGANNSSNGFDNHWVEIGSDALGTLRLSGHGGSSAQSAIDTTAAGDLWNNTLGLSGGVAAAAAGDNSLFYTLPEMMDGVAVTASMSPGRASQETHTSVAVVYTGVEGLTVKLGTGDSGAPKAEIESTTMMASYAYGSFTLSASNTDASKKGAADREITSYQLAYTLSDNVSLTYGEETFDLTGDAIDEEVSGFGASYTTGGMTLSANTYKAENITTTNGAEVEKWALTAAFAF
jgi:outer membrane protein OmpU